MKKIFTFAMAAFGAMTLAPMSHANEIRPFQAERITETFTHETIGVEKTATPQRAAARAAEDFSVLGYYSATYDWGLSGTDPYGMSPVIVAGDKENEVILKNYPNGGNDIICTVDPVAATLTIERQFLYRNSKYDEDVYLSLYDRTTGDFINSITANVESDGTIVFQPDIEIAYYMPELGNSGWMYSAYNVVFTRIETNLFTYNPNEWEACGTAKYCDATLLGLGGFDEEDYEMLSLEVPLYRSKTIKGDYLLMNPYIGDVSFYGMEMSMEEAIYKIFYLMGVGSAYVQTPGYVRFNAANENCVYMYPFVPSGVHCSGWDEFFMYNMEGEMIVAEGMTPAEVENKLLSSGLDTSFYNGKTAYLYNGVMGFTTDMLSNYFWYNGYATGTYRITFDNNLAWWDQIETGVEGINADANAPVKYYDLQGREIANPEKGMMVIKQQGNNVTKQVIR